MIPKAEAKYRKDAIVVPKVKKMTLVVPLAKMEKASFLRQFGHCQSMTCQ